MQHPGKTKVYWIHLGWVLFMFVFLVHFWWWEYHLHSLAVIDVSVYLFVILYSCVFFLLCVFLFPTTLDEYSGYEHYFMSGAPGSSASSPSHSQSTSSTRP